MNLQRIFNVVAFAAAVLLTGPVFAGPNDYAFEPVPAEIKQGNGVVVGVRLVHKPTGKPVPDAVITRSRIDMAPDGMASMDSPLTAIPAKEPGVYAFKTDLTMAGRWQLSVSARVQGEPQPVAGKVVVKAVK
jgi:hypothetical protein